MTVPQVAHRVLPRLDRVGQATPLGRDLAEGFRHHVGDDGRDESGVDVDRDPDVMFLEGSVCPVLEHAVERRMLGERVRERTQHEVGDRRLFRPGVGGSDQRFGVSLPRHRDVDGLVVALLQSIRDGLAHPGQGPLLADGPRCRPVCLW